jgi:hypothetical protein
MTEGTSPAEKKKCFVISPVGSKDSPERKAADQVLRHLIKKALADLYVVQRADDSTNPGAITPDMVASILEADLIVADLTGHNPNVFYEVAMAHGYNKPTVHIQKAGDKVPFDVKDMRVISYDMADPDDLEAAQKLLRESAKFVVENPAKAETPLTRAESFVAIQESTDPTVESNVRIMDEIAQLRRDVLRRIPRSGSVGAARVQDRANNRSARKIIERIVDAGRARPEDFSETITSHTSTAFDNWTKLLIQKITGDDDPAEAEHILFHRDLRTVSTDEAYEPDEDLFRDR